MTHPEPHDLTALAYGLIEGDERDALLEHVADCDACREVYDSYRDEQVAVRDSILADARSGAAEAKALESTLRMLGAMDGEEEEKQGRILRMPYWLVGVEVAAVLMVALGLFFILKPGDDTNKEETVQVAEEDRAPAEVEQGVAYVQDNRGDWRQADAVPVDEWVKTGEGTFTFTLSDGSRAELEPNSMFRITFANGNEPVVDLLHGNGSIDTGKVTAPTYVRAGETGFYAGPGSQFDLRCEGDVVGRPRTWTNPSSVKARVIKGDVMVYADGEMKYIPLKSGEELTWDGEDGFQFTMAKTSLFLMPEPGGEGFYFVPRHPMPEGSNPVDTDEMRKQLEIMLPRFQEWDERWNGDNPKWKGDHEKRMKELRKELETLRIRLKKQIGEAGEIEDIEIELMPDSGVRDTTVLVFRELGLTITLSSDGARLTIEVETPDSITTHSASSLEKLKEMLKPEIAELLDGVKTELDDHGKLRIRGVETSGKNVKVIQKSRQSSSTDSDK